MILASLVRKWGKKGGILEYYGIKIKNPHIKTPQTKPIKKQIKKRKIYFF